MLLRSIFRHQLTGAFFDLRGLPILFEEIKHIIYSIHINIESPSIGQSPTKVQNAPCKIEAYSFETGFKLRQKRWFLSKHVFEPKLSY